MATSTKFGSYTPKTSKTNAPEYSFGMFFDGTLNNKTNTEGRQQYNKQSNGVVLSDANKEKATAYKKYGKSDEKSSYQNEYSNVARIWEGYTSSQRIYIEGIGTTDNKGDDSLGYALGTGETGVAKLVEKGCRLLSEKLPMGKTIAKLTVDVFGFSRGATAARHFVAQLSKPEIKQPKPTAAYGYLGNFLKNRGIKLLQLEIRFLGVYDTVSSYEPRATSVYSRQALNHDFTNDVAELELNNIAKAKCILHLTAENEHRENFALTHVHSGLEKSLPGVHCDIGGSYSTGREYVDEIINGSKAELAKEKERLIQQGWYTEKELGVGFFGPNHKLYGDRESVSHIYSYIPLHMMVDYALAYYAKNGPSGQPKPINKGTLSAKYNFSKDPLLARVNTKLNNYVFKGGKTYTFKWFKDIHERYKGIKSNDPRFATYQQELQEQKDLRLLRNKYLHWSANYDWIGMDPTPNRVRATY